MSEVKDRTQISWVGKRTTKTNVARSKKHEERLAKDLGGKRENASGGRAWSSQDRIGMRGPITRTAGRDITTDKFFIEHKNTVKQSMSFKQAWLEGITKSAKQSFKEPAMIITFEPDPNASPSEFKEAEADWAVLPLSVFKRLIANKEEDE